MQGKSARFNGRVSSTGVGSRGESRTTSPVAFPVTETVTPMFALASPVRPLKEPVDFELWGRSASLPPLEYPPLFRLMLWSCGVCVTLTTPCCCLT